MTNFQSLSTKQGKAFEDFCLKCLKETGWDDITIDQKLPAVEVDFIAHNKHAIAFYFSAKGSERGPRPGLRRTDSFSKAVGEAYYIQRNGLGPCVILTSHMPLKGTGMEKIKLLDREMVLDILELPADLERLKWYAENTEEVIKAELAKTPSLFDVIAARKMLTIFDKAGHKR